MRACSVLALVLVVVCLAPIRRVEANESSNSKAAAAYKAGMAHFQLEEYDVAIEKFQEGFRAEPAPEFLYNIAQAYRLSKRPDKAVSYYQKYLRMRPKAENRSEVEKWIDECRVAAEAQKDAPPPVAPPPAQPQLVTPAAPATPIVARPGEAGAVTASAPPRSKPVYKRGWFWGVIAGGAAVVAGAVVLGVVLSSPSDSSKALPALSFP